MERAGGAGGASEAGDAAPVAAGGAGGGVVKGRSCKGCLFYSSVLRSRSRGPVCVGVTRAIPQAAASDLCANLGSNTFGSPCEARTDAPTMGSVETSAHVCNCTFPQTGKKIWHFPAVPMLSEFPDRMVGEIELEAIQEGRNLSDFKYACVGYSIYLDDKENSTGKGDKQAQLPICVGVELLADSRASTKQASGHLKKEAPQPRRYKHGPGGEDFLTKFQRNAGLVANGVARNLNKVGTYIKDTVGDIMFPYRKPPK